MQCLETSDLMCASKEREPSLTKQAEEAYRLLHIGIFLFKSIHDVIGSQFAGVAGIKTSTSDCLYLINVLKRIILVFCGTKYDNNANCHMKYTQTGMQKQGWG